jgi:hypothetical protein
MNNVTVEERDAIRQLVRSEGWKSVMRRSITPLLLQTNERLDFMGLPEAQTNFYRGVKHTLKRLIEDVYETGQMPNPFSEHMNAFLVTLNLAVDQPSEEPAAAAQEFLASPVRHRTSTPVL